MISASDFRNGITIEKDGSVLEIVEFQHVKPGKGAAFVRTKLKDVINGGVTETTFRPTEKFPQARIDKKEYQYLYADGDLYTFMDTETYDQISLGSDIVGDSLKFVKENEMVRINSYNGNAFSVEPPMFVELEITDTEPGFKGNTATGATKPATVETGAQVAVCQQRRPHQDRHQNRRVSLQSIIAQADYSDHSGRQWKELLSIVFCCALSAAEISQHSSRRRPAEGVIRIDKEDRSLNGYRGKI